MTASDAEQVDANGDGKPDVTIVGGAAAERCRAVDLNFDGVIDAWVYRDSGGQIRRRESDFDRDGRTDEISLYRGGALAEKQRATTMGGRLDTWHFFEGGKLARSERDSDGNGVIDQWWEYTAKGPRCPLIHSDVDGDGRPDPGATIDVCAEGSGYVPPPTQEPEQATGAKFERTDPSAVPSEASEGELSSEQADAIRKESDSSAGGAK